ncbi:MAG: DUF1722 domain-containing protein [Gammaproteobacteria bacterium]|nr:DUF1722 domain-containing protein [Gammaproteobacteria bacterium]
MRIWDIDPGYLNRQSLLGEHRELHGLVAIVLYNKKGYSNHPETKRWVAYGWALKKRHKLLSQEMLVRGYKDRSPVRIRKNAGMWPEIYIDDPADQFSIISEKYRNLECGRIALPKNSQVLWAQHKYSVMARDIELYKSIGRKVTTLKGDNLSISSQLVEILRVPPSAGGIRNVLHHMWGYVSDLYNGNKAGINQWSLERHLKEIRTLAVSSENQYLLSSTALGELGAWLK